MKSEATSKSTLDVSVVVPVYNEVDTVLELAKRVGVVLQAAKLRYEIVFINDGSTDKTWDRIIQARQANKAVRGIRLRRRYWKSAAYMAGFDAAQGSIIITMDGDLQDDPDEIPNFLAKLDEGYDVVTGWKKNRLDPIHKTIPSKIMNGLASRLTGAKVHDMNCGFKAYRREAALDLDLYGDLYRFIPAFAVARGWRLAEIPVLHHPRKHGQSKFGFRRFITGWFDLLTVTFLTSYGSRPSHFFGVAGLSMLGIGGIIDLYLVVLRLATGSIQFKYPLLVFGTTLLLIGLQLILFGLLAELITAKRDRRSLYEVAEALE